MNEVKNSSGIARGRDCQGKRRSLQCSKTSYTKERNIKKTQSYQDDKPFRFQCLGLRIKLDDINAKNYDVERFRDTIILKGKTCAYSGNNHCLQRLTKLKSYDPG